MEDLVAGDLRIAVRDDAKEPVLEMHWTGRSNDRQPERAVRPFVQAVFSAARARSSPVGMHFERLEHFNSSTVALLIDLIQEARNAGLHLEVVYDANLRWQRLSFETLKRLTAKDATIRVRSA
jgi:hypothetical protein